MTRTRIAVIGQSGAIDQALEQLAGEVGARIARGGAILLSGGRDGVMEAACRAAQQEGGLTVGILPGDSPAEGNAYLDVPITTGLGLDFRSLILVHSSDSIIMVGGRIGTLSELATACWNRRPVVVLRDSGCWADRIPHAAYQGRYLQDTGGMPLSFASTPREAVEKALDLARTR